MTNSVPPRPSYAPTPGLVTTQWHTPRPPAAAVPTQLHQAATPIPVLPDNHQAAVDWPRVRRAAGALVTPTTVTGVALAPVWVAVGQTVAEESIGGLRAVVGLAFMCTVFALIAQLTGRSPAALTVIVLVATGTGTACLALWS
jgi:hypothetical protein